MTKHKIFISADHGLALVYFLQSDLIPTLLANGVEVILLTDDQAREVVKTRFGQPGLVVDGLRLDLCHQYANTKRMSFQNWLYYLRWVGEKVARRAGLQRLKRSSSRYHFSQCTVSFRARRPPFWGAEVRLVSSSG